MDPHVCVIVIVYGLCRPATKEIIRLRIHHRGQLVTHPIMWYVGETLSEMNWDWDVDLMFYRDIEKMKKS